MLAGGPPPPPALGNWIQLLLAAHKGPIEGLRGGSAAPAFSPRCSSRLPKRHSIPAQAGGERGSAAPRRKKAGAGGEKGGGSGPISPLLGDGAVPRGPPGPCPWFQPPLFSRFPASGPAGDAPWPPQGLAPARGGGHKGGILWGWQSHRRCHQRPGSGTVPNPPSSRWGDRPRAVPCGAHGPGAVPASCWSRATRPRGCFNAGGGTGPAVPTPNAQRDPRGAGQRAR